MQCPSCGRGNRAEARFCDACGQPLSAPERACPVCGTLNSPGARFCIGCSSSLATTPAAPVRPQPAAEGDLVCPACGYLNRVRFCANCGEALVEGPTPVRRRSPVLSRALSLLVTIVGLMLVAVLSTVAVRFVMSFFMPTVSAPAQPAITQEQAIERANLYVARQYPAFLAAEPTATLALDGTRGVFVVGYTRGSATTLDDPLTTLVVLVDAETGETELLAPGISR